MLKIWSVDQQQELFRNAESDPAMFLLNQNLHWQQDPQVIHLQLKIWAAQTLRIVLPLCVLIALRYTGTSLLWLSTLLGSQILNEKGYHVCTFLSLCSKPLYWCLCTLIVPRYILGFVLKLIENFIKFP